MTNETNQLMRKHLKFRTCGEILLAWGFEAFMRCLRSKQAHREWMADRVLLSKEKRHDRHVN